MIGLKNDVIEKLSLENQGVLKTSDVLAAGVTKDAFYRYIKERGLEKAAHGVYVSPDVFPDEMYLLQAQFPKAIFSHEAALYLHNLADAVFCYCCGKLQQQRIGGKGCKGLLYKSGLVCHGYLSDFFKWRPFCPCL